MVASADEYTLQPTYSYSSLTFAEKHEVLHYGRSARTCGLTNITDATYDSSTHTFALGLSACNERVPMPVAWRGHGMLGTPRARRRGRRAIHPIFDGRVAACCRLQHVGITTTIVGWHET